MNKQEREQIIKVSWELHSQVESNYLKNKAKKGDKEWLEKQRILLADMALHLLQTAIAPERISLRRLRDNLHSILTISDQFLPKAKLLDATKGLYEDCDKFKKSF